MKDSEKLADAGKLSMTDLTQLRARSDVVSYSVMAEMNYFHQARSASFKSMMENFLGEQIKFYQTVSFSSFSSFLLVMKLCCHFDSVLCEMF